MEIKRIAVDTSKAVFTLHVTDMQERVVHRGDLSRGLFEAYIRRQPPTEFVLEACGGSHHWGRQLQGLGHRARLIPPQYVKPFVKRGKTDRADAAAISDAASRPDMRHVPIKTAERQAAQMVIKARELLVRQRTQLVNAVRGHATEFGFVVAKGIERVDGLLAKLAAAPDAGEGAVPELAREMFAELGGQIAEVEARIATLEVRMLAMHKADPVSRRLAKVPGIGPIVAVTLTVGVDATQFESGRHMAAWIGLTPREHSSGGKQRLGGISRAGNERLRQLLVVGAMAVIRHAKPGSKSATPWLLELLARKPRKLAACALANKTARIAWAMMTRGEEYRHPGVAGVQAGAASLAVTVAAAGQAG